MPWREYQKLGQEIYREIEKAGTTTKEQHLGKGYGGHFLC